LGPTGPRGEAGPPGEPGAPGPVGSVSIIVSSTDPGAVAPGTLWVNPDATPPAAPEPEPAPGGGGEIVDPDTGLVDPPIGSPWP
jgi:hypothetical protein